MICKAYPLCCLDLLIIVAIFFIELTQQQIPPNFNKDIFYDPNAEAPLGSHREPSVFLDELKVVPGPLEFHRRYVSRYQPVIFRGAAKHSRSFHLWTEEYLTKTYGNLTVRMESRDEAANVVPVGAGGVGRDTVENFLKNYQTSDSYVITVIPAPMEPDIAILPCLTCGSFSRSIQEVQLFLSAKGGKTLLHRDPYSSVHCVFNGTKQWIVIDPKQKASLYISENSMYEFGGYSDIEVDNVDLKKYPKMRNVEYARVILDKGDCIYMPSGYMHQVRINGHMNAAVSIWFSHYYEFDADGCDDAQPADYQPASEVNILWRYSGIGDIVKSSMDIYMFRTVLRTLADRNGKIWIESFVKKFLIGENYNLEVYQRMQNSVQQSMDPSNLGFITLEDLNSYSIERLKEIVSSIDIVEPSDTDQYEYSYVDPDDIRLLYRVLLKRSKDGTFKRSDFLQHYVEVIGGTTAVGNEILDTFGDGVEQITAEMVDETAEASVLKFAEALDYDPSPEHVWYKHLVKEGIIQKFNVVHDEL
ncbi:uncharacterized protein LOC117291897 [Asterias rubens]|uniref:uncharacterized protein LOC117291897 n=1 Tax=Asterias rubens TaxID=7604 RepID=UPI0014550AAF|nr:uncharacterized protein LOC117291897 [Asterias rubens]